MAREWATLLRLDEAYMPRIWGGKKLRDRFGKPVPNEPIGEAWLVSDHPQHVSRVVEGPAAGRSLHELLEEDPEALLGTHAKPTCHGRFPLLLKLLDAQDLLSVQVHPDDHTAKRLGEPDVGKTEMWHVLDAAPGAELYCGLQPEVDAAQFCRAIEQGNVSGLIARITATPGTNVFVKAGTVHAIGADVLIAEIQQNSDLTYRIDDWGRVDAQGKPRELHIEKALEVIRFGAHKGQQPGLKREIGKASIMTLAACKFFAAEEIQVQGIARRSTRNTSFHLLLGKSGDVTVAGGGEEKLLTPGAALLVAGACNEFTLEGQGSALDYYVPEIEADIVRPLQEAGHSPDAIAALIGDK